MYCFVFCLKSLAQTIAKGAKFRHSYGSQQTTISWSLATNASGRSFWTSSRDLVAGLAIFARGNMFGNMDVAMPAVPLGLDFFAKVLAGKFFPSLTPVVFAFFCIGV